MTPPSGAGKDSAMYIQYVGFDVARGCRIYKFQVLNNLVEARDFAVRVGTGAFCSTSLRLQDGPDICYGRLKQKLETETDASRVDAQLTIGDQDIQEYLEQHRGRGSSINKSMSYRRAG
jgi:hypothetical protein